MPPEYSVRESAQPLSEQAITAALTTRRLGRPVRFFERVGSTNNVARQMAEAGAAEGLVVVADEQTAGKGRLNRSWWAPPGSSLLMSLLLRPSLPLLRAGQLAMCLGLGAVEGIEEVTGLRPALKWPNDLVVNGRKLGGMLVELAADGDALSYAVLGLGLNVTWQAGRRSSFVVPADIAATATDLAAVLGRQVNRLPLLAGILACTEKWYERTLAEQPSPSAGGPVVQAWAARLDTLGHAVSVRLGDGEVRGDAVGVSPEGALLVRDEAGRVHTLWAGDVTSLRPATD